MTQVTSPSFHPEQRARAETAVQRAIDYLCSRQSGNGGFCFYRWLGIDEPNLHDTWHAVAALTLAGTAVPRAGAVADSLAAYAIASTPALYQYTFTLDRLGFAARVGRDELQRIRALDPAAALRATMPLTAQLESTLHAVSLQRRFGAVSADRVALADQVTRRSRAGAWGDKPNLHDTALAVAILTLLDLPSESDATRDFIDSLQVPSFGFAATQDSLFADLDTVYAGLAACALLGMPVRHRGDTIDYVLACQGGNGGFARTPDGLADIARTHRALRALSLVGVIDATPGGLPAIAAAP